MPRFRYSAYDQHGALKKGDLDAGSREAALEALHKQGFHPLELVTASDGRRQRWWEREVFGDGRLPLSGLALLTRELSTLINADIPLDEALKIVRLQPLLPSRIRKSTQSLLDDVRGGKSLSGAMAARGREFPEYYWRLVQSGEASGALGDVLENMSIFLERSVELRSQITSALIYPAVLLVAALVAVGVILTVLLPTVLPLFNDAGAPPPAFLKFLVDAESFVSRNWLGSLAAVSILFVLILLGMRNSALRLWLDGVILRLPLVGRFSANRETARLSRTLATLMRNGIAMLDAVQISASTLRNRAFAAAVTRAGDALKQGGTLSRPLEQSGLFSELSLRLISVGEQTGQLDTMLTRVAVIYEATIARQIARLMTLLTPVLTLLIGGMVGGLILSVMSAILSVNDLALQ